MARLAYTCRDTGAAEFKRASREAVKGCTPKSCRKLFEIYLKLKEMHKREMLVGRRTRPWNDEIISDGHTHAHTHTHPTTHAHTHKLSAVRY